MTWIEGAWGVLIVALTVLTFVFLLSVLRYNIFYDRIGQKQNEFLKIVLNSYRIRILLFLF